MNDWLTILNYCTNVSRFQVRFKIDKVESREKGDEERGSDGKDGKVL